MSCLRKLVTVLLVCSTSVHAEQGFNFEVSKHIVDVIDRILDVGTWPHKYSGGIFATHFLSRFDVNATSHMFYYLLQAVPQARHVYASFEDGQFIGVVRGSPGIPALKSTYNLSGEYMYSYRGPGDNISRSYYETDQFGLPTDFLQNTTYDGRERAWYKQAKAANRSIWAGPYIFASIKEAGMTYCTILANETGLDGVLAVDFSLNDISDFLAAQYKNSEREVRIMDSTNLIIGTSTGQDLRLQNSTMVTASSDAKLMSLLDSRPFNTSDSLRVIGKEYVQIIHFFKNDTLINWLIVVTMPAEPSKDFLLLGDPETGGIEAVSVLAGMISIVGVIIFVRYRDAKIIRMSQRPMIGIFLVGCVMLNCSLFALLQQNTINGCRLAGWWPSFWFTFAFAPILIKTWLLLDIFRGNNRAAALKYSRSWWIGKFIGLPAWLVLVLIQTLLLVGSTVAGEMDPYTVTFVGVDSAYETHTYCGPAMSAPWRVAGFVYQATLLGTGFILALLTRGINFFLAESWSVVVIVYSISVFVSVIFLVLVIADLVVADDILLRVIAMTWSTSFSILVLLGPRFHKLFTIGDKAAMNWLRRGPLSGAASIASKDSSHHHPNNSMTATSADIDALPVAEPAEK